MAAMSLTSTERRRASIRPPSSPPGARLIGDIEIGAEAGIWYHKAHSRAA
jgi:carbonic anhydrase/acetyltransferase-like protein (isoleucine patch superfamily)